MHFKTPIDPLRIIVVKLLYKIKEKKYGKLLTDGKLCLFIMHWTWDVAISACPRCYWDGVWLLI